MSKINKIIAGLELVQIGWVVPDIHAAVKFLSGTLGVAGFPDVEESHVQWAVRLEPAISQDQ